MAIFSHPAKNATNLGPKSLAGFNPAWVIDPNKLINKVKVNPIMRGAKPLVLCKALLGSKDIKITNAKTAGQLEEVG